MVKKLLCFIIIFINFFQIASYAVNKNEMRGVWISDPTNFQWEEVIKDLKKSGFNNIFVNFASAGVAFYESKILPQKLPKESFKKLIDLAHKEGIYVHAKVLAFFMYWAPKEQVDLMMESGRVLLSSKGNVQLQAKTPWLDPSQVENRNLVQSIIQEIIQNYEVDGIQLDYVRFYEEKGIPESILNIRTSVLTNFVSDTRRLIHGIKPELRYSACIFYDLERAKHEMAQDWETWVDKSIFNFLVPMNYTISSSNLMKWIYAQDHIFKGGITLYSGLGAYMKGMTPDILFDQISVLRRADIPGFILFSYNPAFSKEMLPELRKKLKGS